MLLDCYCDSQLICALFIKNIFPIFELNSWLNAIAQSQDVQHPAGLLCWNYNISNPSRLFNYKEIFFSLFSYILKFLFLLL